MSEKFEFGPLNIIKPTNNKQCSGIVIFFHGSGDKGDGLREWIKYLLGDDLKFPHLQVVYPTAPLQPYTPLNGAKSNVWFNRFGISPDVPDDKKSLDEIGKQMSDFIENEIAGGSDAIPLNRIILGGFSMGGGLSLHLAYKYIVPKVAGVFTLSSFLGTNSLIYDQLKSTAAAEQMPLFMCHGERDDLVPIEWGRKTYNQLLAHGITNAEFHPIQNTFHEIKKVEIDKLRNWILKVLPPHA